jgi:Domain of unknown function DUF29
MPPPTSSTPSDLYERDQVAWLDAMVALIRRGAVQELDFARLEEFLSDLALRARREVDGHLVGLLTHTLKWTHLPRYRSPSWKETIIQQRHELARLVGRGVLRSHAESALPAAFAEAVECTVLDTDMSAETFANDCPQTLVELMRFDYAGE